jgi:hypothetical protein
MRPCRISPDPAIYKYPFFFLLFMAKTKRKPSKYNICVGRAIREMNSRTSTHDIKEKFKKAAAMCKGSGSKKRKKSK